VAGEEPLPASFGEDLDLYYHFGAWLAEENERRGHA
jgi:hypothetical protein